MGGITRRETLGLAAGAAGWSLVSALPAWAAESAPGFYRYQAGNLKVTAVSDGFFVRKPLEGFVANATPTQIDASLTAQGLPAGELKVPFTTLVVDDGKRVVLIDTGTGDMGPPTAGTWMANFRAAGYAPERVDAVVVSHFHGDHVNGLRLKDGTAVFPKAEVHVPAPEWDYWMSEEKMASAPERAQGNFKNVRRVFGPMAADVRRFKPGDEVLTGIASVAAHGHTPGHTVFVIGGKLLSLQDTTNHPALFATNPGWHVMFDMDGAAAEKTRRRMLDMAAADKMQVAFYHAPFPATGTVQEKGDGYQFVPA